MGAVKAHDDSEEPNHGSHHDNRSRYREVRFSGSSATVRTVENSYILKISKPDFERLMASNYQLAEGIELISHARAISNLATSNVNPEIWAKVANRSLDRVNRHEANKLLAETGKGAGMAIALGNVLDTIQRRQQTFERHLLGSQEGHCAT